ncbi:MAG: Fe-S cluster assembly protein HesB [Chloroflexota bacterium]|nr:Fe-S cluster assembly protein HesB [Chloroflexota bacterium]
MDPIRIPLVGPAGEPVNLRATIDSHGVATLPPAKFDPEHPDQLTITLRLRDGTVRTVYLTEAEPGVLGVEVLGSVPAEADAVVSAVRHVFRLDQDLSGFYMLAAADPHLSWVCAGCGRMMRCATVFEDVIKTILTTNCSWAATVKMTERIVTELGEPDLHVQIDAPYGRAFPTPDAMAAKDETFYRETIRAGYRAPHLVKLSTAVATGELDLERLGTRPVDEMDDDALAKELLALPGVGPYAAAHIMHMLGRQSRLILDSWTRPTYARLLGVETVTDQEIVEAHTPYGAWAGLAFWMRLTRNWTVDQAADDGV